VNVAKQEDSRSDSSWFVRDDGESLEEDAEWVTGDGIEVRTSVRQRTRLPRTRRTASHTSLDSPLLEQRLSPGMSNFQC
jgi:hypothetical protein